MGIIYVFFFWDIEKQKLHFHLKKMLDHKALKADAEKCYKEKCELHPEFIPATRVLGNCVKCDRELIEYCDTTGIWCYNAGMNAVHQIVWSKGAFYYCRNCASTTIIRKHDRTF